MANDYEGFKKNVYALTSIDLNSYKERQMKRRIDTLIAKNKYPGYDEYIAAIKKDKALLRSLSIISLSMCPSFTEIGAMEDS